MNRNVRPLFLALLLLLAAPSAADVVEEIVAVVNDEVITASDLRKYELEMTRMLQQQFEGESLEKALQDMRANMLERLIDQRLLESVIKQKNYNVDADVDYVIQDIKKQNRIGSDEELKKALATEGIEWGAWKDMWRERLKQERLIRDEVGSKIKVENPQIMSYFREHEKEYTVPAEFTVEAVFLRKEGDAAALAAAQAAIDAELAAGPFAEVARKHSQLPNTDNPALLGTFHPGELDKTLDEALAKMKKGDRSEWIETESGWYRLHLAEWAPARLRQLQDVREEIVMRLREQLQPPKVKEYLEQLRKESYIKIHQPQ